MNELIGMIDAVQKMGFVGLLIILAIPALRTKLGFGNGDKHSEEDHKEIWKAIADVRDNHLHEIKNCLSQVKQDVAWVKGKLDN